MVRRPASVTDADGSSPVGYTEDVVIYQARFPVSAAGVRRARVAVSEALRGRVPEPTVDDVALITSELVTNAVRHSGTEGDGQVDVRLERKDRHVVLQVIDHGPGFEPADPVPREESGWGLLLVDRISERWGVRTGEASSVWAEIPL